MRVPLTQGFFALVDEADYPLVAARKWSAHRCKGGVYAASGGHGHQVHMHRFILGAKPGETVTFRNDDTLDYRRSNLVLCTRRELGRTIRKPVRAGVPYRGVRRSNKSQRWEARIRVEGGELHLGTHATAEAAALAYDAAARTHHEPFAQLNFPDAIPVVPQAVEAVRIVERHEARQAAVPAIAKPVPTERPARKPRRMPAAPPALPIQTVQAVEFAVVAPAKATSCVRCEILPDRENPLIGNTCSWCCEEMVSTPKELAERRAAGEWLTPELITSLTPPPHQRLPHANRRPTEFAALDHVA